MSKYVLRRLLLIIPTLLGIMTINFVVVQLAPGGGVEQLIARLSGFSAQYDNNAFERVSGGGSDTSETIQSEGNTALANTLNSAQARGVDPELLETLIKQYGFDKPLYERYWITVRNLAVFDLGVSHFRDQRVISLLLEKLPVSISLGLWTTILVYFISIPLGIAKALRQGTRFDTWSSVAVIVGNAIPAFLFALLLLILFAGGRFLDLFPLRGLTSDNWDSLSTFGKVIDYLWHLVLPLTAMVIGSFASLTLLVRNSFLEHMRAQYVLLAQAKGLSHRQTLYRHVFRNATLIIIAGLPSALVGIFFASATFIEILFSLDGLGLLLYESVLNRDYPVFFGALYISAWIGLLLGVITDLTYHWVDPRIDFEAA